MKYENWISNVSNRLTVSEEDVCRFVSKGGQFEVINESTNRL